MNYDFRDGVRRALAFARAEANQLGHDYVGTEHMLLGLLRLPESRAMELVEALGSTGDELRQRVEGTLRRGRASHGMGELPYTSRAKKVLEFSMRAARELGDRHIDTEHLLLGLLREEKGIGAHVLKASGVTLERVHAVLEGVDPGPRPEGWAGPAVPEQPLRLELDDQSDLSIYEQIIARIQEAVATGELAPGARLPAVRQLADRLDIAPGTVARAYGELERLGVVVTEGARGTRIAEPAAPSAGRPADLEHIAGLLRPAAVAGFHMGASADDMRRALEAAMKGIFAE
ncbi:MAG TPA: Clp protease N-terminal domain-containing protein [Longimicrobiales bacterium]|nr:Clp protease N-terminal domain-containing protein [Longimicrobiales bacterium]